METVHSHLAKRAPLVSEFRDDVPMELVQVIDKLLSKQKQDRDIKVLMDLVVIFERSK
jgi:hypothetical protein